MIEYVDQLTLANGIVVRVSVRIPPLSNKEARNKASDVADEMAHKAAEELESVETAS